MAMKGSAAWILAMNSSGKVVYWAGVTTTPISDGSTTNPVMINGSSVTIRPGGAVGYNGNEFVLSEDGVWQEFGETDVQHKTLDTPIDVDDTEVTTVEGALSAINEYAEDIEDSLGTASAKNAISVVTDSSDLVESGAVKDIVGWGNKNLLNCNIDFIKANNTHGTWNGNTFTYQNCSFVFEVDDYGYVLSITKINPTPTSNDAYINIGSFTFVSTESYIITGGVNSNAYLVLQGEGDKKDVGEGLTISNYSATNKMVQIVAKIADTTTRVFYPMIRKATVSDPAFEPYHASVEDSLEEKVGWNEAEGYVGKNLLPEQPISEVMSGVTFTTLDINEYTVSGTDSSYAQGISSKSFILPKGSYKIVTYVTNPKSTLYVQLRSVDGITKYVDVECNSSLDFTLNNDTEVKLRIVCNYMGESVTYNATIKVMICKQSVKDLTFERYLIPNTEISTKADNSVIGTVENGATASQAYAVGEHFIRDGAFCTCTQAIAQGGTFTLNTNYTAGDVADILTVNKYAVTAKSPFFVSANTQLIKIGNMVILSLRIDDVSCSANTTILIGSVASDVKPKLSLNGVFVTFNNVTGRLLISDLGEIKINSSSALSSESILANLIWNI